MIGLILIYFLGKAFYNLAEEYNKHNWGFAILGVATYYAGSFVGGIILGIFFLFVLDKNIEGIPNAILSLMAMPFGLLACWGLYKILQNQWMKTSILPVDEILDSDLLNRNTGN